MNIKTPIFIKIEKHRPRLKCFTYLKIKSMPFEIPVIDGNIIVTNVIKTQKNVLHSCKKNPGIS